MINIGRHERPIAVCLGKCWETVFVGILFLIAFTLISEERTQAGELRTEWNECFSNPSSGCLISEALHLGRRLNDGRSRAQSLLIIGKAQANLSLVQDARATFNEAAESIQSLNAETRSSLFQAIAFAQASAGLKRDSISTFNLSRAGHEQSDWASGLHARLYALNGDIDSAVQILGSIEDESERINPLVEIAKAHIRNKRPERPPGLAEAENIVRSHPEIYPRFRIDWLCDIAETFIEAKSRSSARSVLRLASNISQSRMALEDQPKRRARWLSRLAAEEAKAGLLNRSILHFRRAIRAVEIEKNSMHGVEHTADEGLQFLIARQAEARLPRRISTALLTKSEALALSFERFEYRAELLADIAEAKARLIGKKPASKAFSRSVQIAASIPKSESRSRDTAINRIAIAQAKSGFTFKAITTFRSAYGDAPEELRIETLCALAEALETSSRILR